MASADRDVDNILSFDATNQELTILDNIENRQCKIHASDQISFQDTSIENFTFPVDRAISILVDKLTINNTNLVYIRNHAGVVIEEVKQGDIQTLPYDKYTIEISVPIKLYISFESAIKLKATSEQVIISFEELTEVLIGARSHHKQPSASIKTTKDPEDLVQAVSQFGSAIKTTACERSYPTLRGHPPDLSLSDELVIPSILEKPETDITIEVSGKYQDIFVIAPLAYYLGADVVSGGSSLIKSRGSLIHDLEGTSRDFEDEVGRVLKQCFFFDCITRTEGFYQVKLHERERVENRSDLDFSALYGQPISDQIRSYLSVPYESISDLVPMWKKVAHVEIDPSNIEILPYLTNDLSIIHCKKETYPNYQDLSSQSDESEQLRKYRKSGKLVRGVSSLDETLRSSETTEEVEKLLEVPRSNALENTWVGKGIPIGASKAIPDAYKNYLNQSPTDGNIDIAVVVNDDEMIQEGVIVDDVYNSRDQLSLSTELQQQLSKEELRNTLNQDYDFLHYVGHIDENGFKCVDGALDATNLNDISIRTFLLNACTSYQQAIGLIESGAIAGIATIKPILNSGAKRIGKVVARLLNLGFPLISSLKIAGSESIMGDNYIVIGDGSVNLTQPKGSIPSLCQINKLGSGYEVVYKTFPTKKESLGTIILPYAKNNETYYLASGETGEFKMDKNELLRFITMGEMPIKLDSSLYWSEENEIVNELG